MADVTPRRRVLVVSRSRVRVGGLESYVASAVSGLRRAGHTVSCWFESSETGDDAVLESGTDVPHWTAADGDEGLAAMRAWNPDVVFVNGVESPAWERALMTLAPAIFFAHAYHGVCVSGTKTWMVPVVQPCQRTLGAGCLALYFPRRCGGRSPATLTRLYRVQRERQGLLGGYARVLVASRHMAEEYARHGVGSSVSVVPLPVETPAVASAPCRGDDQPWRLLYLGRFEETKGPHLALESAALVAGATSRHVSLQLSGAGALRDSLADRASRLMAHHANLRVELTPWLSRDASTATLDDADLLLVPSLWPEPFGLVGVEAARRAVPAVAFAVGGIPDWLTDGVTGRLVRGVPTAASFAEAVMQTLGDRESLQRMRAACLLSSGRFTLARHLRALDDVFAAVLDGKRGVA